MDTMETLLDELPQAPTVLVAKKDFDAAVRFVNLAAGLLRGVDTAEAREWIKHYDAWEG